MAVAVAIVGQILETVFEALRASPATSTLRNRFFGGGGVEALVHLLASGPTHNGNEGLRNTAEEPVQRQSYGAYGGGAAAGASWRGRSESHGTDGELVQLGDVNRESPEGEDGDAIEALQHAAGDALGSLALGSLLARAQVRESSIGFVVDKSPCCRVLTHTDRGLLAGWPTDSSLVG